MIRNLDLNHDWTFGAGRSNYLENVEEIALNAKTRVLCFLNDCFFDMDMGIGYWNLLDRNRQRELENAIQQQIIQTPGIVGVTEINAYTNADRKLSVQYSAKTIYSVGFNEYLTLGGLNVA